MGAQRGPEDESVVPQLAADCDLGSLTLTPAEGYLLSRVDGRTSWALLREQGALPPEEVDSCLRRLAEQGVVELGDEPDLPEAEPAASASDAGALSAELEALIDPALDIPVASQRSLLTFELGLERPYHAILGVPANADARAVRRAYFVLSKEFHPDRYFRRNLGPFAERVERVFRKIAEAHALLSDPSARKEVEKSLASAAPAAASAASGAPSAAPRLRGRTTPHAFSLVARIQRERRRKARNYFQLGQQAVEKEKWVDAAQHLRLAIACDPTDEEFKGLFGDVNRRANEILAERYMREADSLFQLGEYSESYKRYEDALHCRPFDVEANLRAAKLAWRVENDLRAAKEYAARACEIAPDVAANRKTLGQIYAAAGLHKNAQRELDQALRLDPRDEETRQELKTVKRLARSAPLGGS